MRGEEKVGGERREIRGKDSVNEIEVRVRIKNVRNSNYRNEGEMWIEFF